MLRNEQTLVVGSFTLAGVVIGACLQFFSSYIIARMAQQKQQRDVHTRKLEDLFFTALRINEQLTGLYINCLMKLQGQKINTRDVDKDRPPLMHAEMIVSIYFPDMIPHLRKIISIRDKASPSVARCIQLQSGQSLSSTETSEIETSLSDCLYEMQIATEIFQKQILTKGKVLNL